MIKSGSGRAGRLSELFRDFRGPLRRYLAHRKSRSADDIDDIAQEVFVRLLRYEREQLVDHPRAYLFKIASNVSAEWSMRSSCRLPHDSAWLDELADAMSPETELDREKGDELLADALSTLPKRMRDILYLQFTEGLSQPEVADRLGITHKIVRRDVGKAYELLRSALEELSPNCELRQRRTSP